MYGKSVCEQFHIFSYSYDGLKLTELISMEIWSKKQISGCHRMHRFLPLSPKWLTALFQRNLKLLPNQWGYILLLIYYPYTDENPQKWYCKFAGDSWF